MGILTDRGGFVGLVQQEGTSGPAHDLRRQDADQGARTDSRRTGWASPPGRPGRTAAATTPSRPCSTADHWPGRRCWSTARRRSLDQEQLIGRSPSTGAGPPRASRAARRVTELGRDAAPIVTHADGDSRLSPVLGQRLVQPLADAVEPLLADRGELLAALPERERLLEGGAAGLEPADGLDQLLAGGLVGERRARRPAQPSLSSRSSVRVVVAWTRPSATRTVIADSGLESRSPK